MNPILTTAKTSSLDTKEYLNLFYHTEKYCSLSRGHCLYHCGDHTQYNHSGAVTTTHSLSSSYL